MHAAKSPDFEETVVAENDRGNRFIVSFNTDVILRMRK